MHYAGASIQGETECILGCLEPHLEEVVAAVGAAAAVGTAADFGLVHVPPI